MTQECQLLGRSGLAATTLCAKKATFQSSS